MKKLWQKIKCFLRFHPESEMEVVPGSHSEGTFHNYHKEKCKKCNRIEEYSIRKRMWGG